VGLVPPAVRDVDDLGWNDLGEDHDGHHDVHASPVAAHLATLQSGLAAPAQSPTHNDTTDAAEVEAQPVAPVAKPKRPAARMAPTVAIAPATGRKSAFTLRIDPERHLRLRLLSAVRNQSAQQLLIAALDALLAANPDINDLADDPKTRSAAGDTGIK